MKILSWNVNGLRACYNKGAFTSFLEHVNPDILFLQETKLQPDQVPPELDNPNGYYTEWNSAEKKGYSSVALFSKVKPLQVFKEIGVEKFDREGRVIGIETDDFIAFGVYFPNGQMSEERLAYKLEFYDVFFNYCNKIADHYKKPLFISGDYNTAHKEIDLARPKENETVSGFLPIEREWLDKLIDQYGYQDTFRKFNTNKDEYSWWSYRARARDRNVGWRIDYVFSNEDSTSLLKDAFILQDIKGSDHCPVGIELHA
ncbi:exodeoxyribonuclease III [Candidatus Marinamargulisbacteria bacterium SCGC AG-343-D04]|nr:exodeoxyribonuclease III [Candidatus Marinamargulisbacteria bacterium SCGC AG-343-D04]